MHVVKRKTLVEFWRKHANSEAPLVGWYREAKSARWKSPQDIKDHYRSADFLPGNRVVFNIGGNKYRLVVKIAYVPGTVYIRFIGTHAEYDKTNAETV
ncbi:type II toxin-antitoxin system HigB family toxin [Pontiella sulfatireligans]|uniref:mRNA interferase HigB n=1 Tax=Pontiella sulfatireligans TaxID=2750658 RepID=A0A6C2UL23_9BACT|nr:type II toxin-antitoxin system HigB family toxin [Pontiella sulfatireligans]VGO20945.1 mRNA interferase HigB [Pontiella sulfatireligans]